MTSTGQRDTDEAQIRACTAGWAGAIHDKDVERVLSYYAKQVRSFGLEPPLEFRGAAADMKGALVAWFQTWDGPIGYEIRDQEIELGGDLAYTHGLHHMTGRKKDGETPDLWFRVTAGFRRVGGRWLIAHEHSSVPFHMQTLKASLDLKP